MTYKGYLSGWEDSKSDPRLKDYLFTTNPNIAVKYESAEQAENECRFYDSAAISIPSNQGGKHMLRGFRCEELSPGEFVIYCEGPYIPARLG
jgi:hypothetical protein